MSSYQRHNGEPVFIACMNWVPGIIAKQIKYLPDEESPIRLADLFSEPDSKEWAVRSTHQRNYEWRQILEILYPDWAEYEPGFEGLGSLFGSETK